MSNNEYQLNITYYLIKACIYTIIEICIYIENYIKIY